MSDQFWLDGKVLRKGKEYVGEFAAYEPLLLRELLTDKQAQKAQPPCGADGVWRPIETAPLDGRAVLVMSDNWPGTKSGRAETCNGHNTYVAEWWAESNEWMCYMSLPCEPVCPIAPTHWMPLPDVPSSQPAAPVAPATVAVPDVGLLVQALEDIAWKRHPGVAPSKFVEGLERIAINALEKYRATIPAKGDA